MKGYPYTFSFQRPSPNRMIHYIPFNSCINSLPLHIRNTGVRILSIDGGGSRGLVVAMMLERIEKVLNLPEFHAGNHDNRVQIWQLFDLIIGKFPAENIAQN